MYDDADRPAFVLGADEGHETFSPLFDPSIVPGSSLADGGGAFCVDRNGKGAKCGISIPFYQSGRSDEAIDALVAALGITDGRQSEYALVMAGIPAAMHGQGELQLARFLDLFRLSVPVVRYRRFTGEFASASAVAAALAASFVETGVVPGAFAGGSDIAVDARHNKILVLGLGRDITAMELYRP
jgi:hypothetical protein